MANRPDSLNMWQPMACRWCGKTPRDMKRHQRDCPKRPIARSNAVDNQPATG